MLTLSQLEEQLLARTLVESPTVEFKASLPKLDQMAKLLVAMANNEEGGFVLIGVENNQGGSAIVGLNDKTIANLPSYLDKVISEFTTGISYKYYTFSVGEKICAIVHILDTNECVYYSRRSSSPERVISYQRVGTVNEQGDKLYYSKLFKYMPLDTFILSLNSGSIRFVEPSVWDDQYEKRFYCANYHFPGAENSTPRVYATCFTSKSVSNAAWKVYSHNKGLGAYCVQLEINVVKLRNQIESSGMKIVEKKVVYMPESKIRDTHKRGSELYGKYFSEFNIHRFLELLSIKRNAYDYEKEVRMFVIPDLFAKRDVRKGKGDHYDIRISWKDVINKIRIDKNCPEAELQSLYLNLIINGIKLEFKKKCPFATPSLDKRSLSKTISVPAELFNVDEMSGDARIDIY